MTENETDYAEIAQISRELTEIESELREAHGEPVVESPSMTVYADEHLQELNEIADDEDVDRATLSEWMHEQARGFDYDWGYSDPIVVLHDGGKGDEEDGRTTGGDISLAGHVVENPMDATDDEQILWEREGDSEEISTDGGDCLPEEGEKWRYTEEDKMFMIHHVDDTHVHMRDEGERYAPTGDSAGKITHEEWKDAVEEYEVYERVEEGDK